MRYSITFREDDYRTLTESLFPADTERAAYLLCGLSVGPSETKLLVREVVPVGGAEIASASSVHISIPSTSYAKWLKRANDAKACIVFVHSHPQGQTEFSPQDDSEEPHFFRTAHTRIRGKAVHGSLLLSSPNTIAGRVWLPGGESHSLECIRIIGSRFRFIRDYGDVDPQLVFFDRQIRAFGRDFQPVLRELRVGIVGVGGTGSSVGEQLIRLGVGHLVIVDGGLFETSNINRVYGSNATDDGLPKPDITRRLSDSVGLGTEVTTVSRPISYRSAMAHLKDCDVVFGCTDDQWGRSLLTLFAVQYLTPVIDMGVAINPHEDGTVERVEGRVTTLMAGSACLFCRNRINPEAIRAQSAYELDPTQAEALHQEGYLLGIPETAPSVIPFTSTIASSAVMELLHRLTGFMGEERVSTEVLHRFDWSRVRTNSQAPACSCADKALWGVGDRRPMLDVIWRPEL